MSSLHAKIHLMKLKSSSAGSAIDTGATAASPHLPRSPAKPRHLQVPWSRAIRHA